MHEKFDTFCGSELHFGGDEQGISCMIIWSGKDHNSSTSRTIIVSLIISCRTASSSISVLSSSYTKDFWIIPSLFCTIKTLGKDNRHKSV